MLVLALSPFNSSNLQTLTESLGELVVRESLSELVVRVSLGELVVRTLNKAIRVALKSCCFSLKIILPPKVICFNLHVQNY